MGLYFISFRDAKKYRFWCDDGECVAVLSVQDLAPWLGEANDNDGISGQDCKVARFAADHSSPREKCYA